MERTLGQANEWRRAKNDGGELFCLLTFVAGRLRFALRETRSLLEGLDHSFDADLKDALARIPPLVTAVYRLPTGPQPGTPACSAFHLLTAIHCLWLVNADAQPILTVLAHPQVHRWLIAGPFWSEYSEGVAALSSDTVWTPRPIKVAGYARHWYPYLELMSVWTRRAEDTAALARIQRSFEARNRDRRLVADLDGDGHHPVNWDFRLESLRLFHTRRTGAA